MTTFTSRCGRLIFPGLALALLLCATIALQGCGNSGPSGTYVATDPGGSGATFSIEFATADKAKIVMGDGPMKVEFECDYSVDGDKITIQSPMPDDDEPLILTMKGNTLEGNMDGDNLVFQKQ